MLQVVTDGGHDCGSLGVLEGPTHHAERVVAAAGAALFLKVAVWRVGVLEGRFGRRFSCRATALTSEFELASSRLWYVG